MTPERPSLRSWLSSALQGGVPLDEVRARLRAGAVAYDDYLAAESLRRDLVDAGLDPTTASPAETGQLLCAWNAFALQSLAVAFVEAEERATGRVPSSVPEVTARQVDLLVRDVPIWSGRARRAAVDPGYDVAAEVPLPSQMLMWVIVEPCPRSHLTAMRAGAAAMLERLEAALADLQRATRSGGAGRLATLRGMVADVQGRTGSVDGMLGGAGYAGMHEQAETALRDAVQRCFILGQLMARPRLVSRAADIFAASPAPQAAPWPAPPPAPPAYPGPPWPGYGHHYGGHHGGHHD